MDAVEYGPDGVWGSWQGGQIITISRTSPVLGP